jgi:hypothetical protein
MIKTLPRWMSVFRRHGDWGLFVAVSLGLAAWAAWYLSPEPEGPALRMGWDFDAPTATVRLGELKGYIAEATPRIKRLEEEVRTLRGIRKDDPADRQLREILGRAVSESSAEAYILHAFRPRRNVFPPEEDSPPVPLTPRQHRIVALAQIVDQAWTLRAHEALLQALAADSQGAQDIAGYYTDCQVSEMWVTRVPEGVRVEFGSAFGFSKRSYGYDGILRKEGNVFKGELVQMMPEEQRLRFAMRFDRGIVTLQGDTGFRPCETLVKFADYRFPGHHPDGAIQVGGSASSRCSWEARERFLRDEVVWVSPARPSFVTFPEGTYYICDEALRGGVSLER